MVKLVTFIRTFFLSATVYGVCLQTAAAQAFNNDSLEMVLKTRELTSYEQMTIYSNLCRNYITTNFPKSKSYAYIGIALAKKEADRKMLAGFYRNLGAAFTFAGVYDSASFFLDKASVLAKEINDQNLQAYVLLSVAALNTRKNNYQLALEQFFKVLSVFEKTGDKVNQRKAIGSIAALYMYQENYVLAEKYYLKAEKISLSTGDISGSGQACQGLSRIYFERKEMDKALDYATKSATAFHSSGEKGFESVALKEIANIYLSVNNPGKSGVYADRSLELAKLSQVPRYISNCLIVLSDIALYKKDYKQSIQYALEALRVDSTDADTKTKMYETLIKASVLNNQSKEAVSFFQQYRKVIDSRISETYQKSLSEMEVRYETEKKVFRISALEKENQLSIVLIVGGVIVFLLLFLFLYVREKNEKHKKELAERKVIQLEQEKKLISTQAVLDGETAERTRLARDLHDGLGSMLSVIKLHLYDIKKAEMLKKEADTQFDKALEMLESSTKELRRVAHNLMPESLAGFGLKASLQDFLGNIPHAHLHYFGEEARLIPQLEIVIYRTVHELVNNALKHSGAENINVQVVQHPDSISITVQDDGNGFDISEIKEGYGLKGIESRVSAFKGTMNIFSKKGEGTEISIEFKKDELV